MLEGSTNLRGMAALATKAPSLPADVPTKSVTAAALGVTLGLAGICGVFAVRDMHGMDMGVATSLGSFASFVAVWVPMMAVMMFPGAVPAVSRYAAVARLRAVPAFLGLYLAVWAVVGVAIYVLYRPHGTVVAGAVTIAAGVYELTPYKVSARQRCQQTVRSGFGFGLSCVGSSLGLMAMFIALGIMSVTWMAVVGLLVAAQKLLRPKSLFDVPLAVALVGLGTLVVVAPSVVPGLTGSM
jgi:predicted metal-binding membrane protein